MCNLIAAKAVAISGKRCNLNSQKPISKKLLEKMAKVLAETLVGEGLSELLTGGTAASSSTLFTGFKRLLI